MKPAEIRAMSELQLEQTLTDLHVEWRNLRFQEAVGRHAGDLEEDAAGLDDGNPVLRVALAGTHARLRRLLRDGLVWEDPDPNLAAAAQMVGDRPASGLDLAAVDPAR